jgi:hypothetical protein
MPRVSVPLQPPQSWNYELSDPSLEKKVGRNGNGLCVCVCVCANTVACWTQFFRAFNIIGWCVYLKLSRIHVGVVVCGVIISVVENQDSLFVRGSGKRDTK